MFDLVARAFAGLLICAAIGVVIYYSPALISWIRHWLDREDPRDIQSIAEDERPATRSDSHSEG